MNKLMLGFLVVDFLFLACGGLLIGFSLVSEQKEKSVPTIATVAYNLLLTECPLTCKKYPEYCNNIKSRVLTRVSSWCRQRNIRFRRLLILFTGARPSIKPNFPQNPGLGCHLLFIFYSYSGSFGLVRHSSNSQKSQLHLGPAVNAGSKLAAAEGMNKKTK
jgi:hypothetical protein